MAKLETLPLAELYGRKATASVEKAILLKEDFSQGKVVNWCDKVCKLRCKNPPSDLALVPQGEVDVLIVQDYKAFDERVFKKKGPIIEQKHREVIHYIAKNAFKAQGDFPELSFSITQLLKCQITEVDLKKGKAPSESILAKCKPYLLAEIAARKPKVIISLCSAVTKALGYKKANYANRGEIVKVDGRIPLVLTIHPRTLLMLRQNASGKFWGPDFFRVILRDFQKAAGVARGTLNPPKLAEAIAMAKRDIRVARSLDAVKRYTKRIFELGISGQILAVDTETNGLDPFAVGAKLLCIQFSARNENGIIETFVLPLWHRENRWYDANEAWKLIGPILGNPNIKKIGHNVRFDMRFIEVTTKVRVNGVLFDTMLLLHALDSGTQGTFGLKQAVVDFLPHTGLGGYEALLPALTKENIEFEDEENEDYPPSGNN